MFKFGGWKASLNLGGPGGRREVYENGPDLSVGGAYRMHREEFFGRENLLEPPKKLTPSMVQLPPSKEALKSSKSANDLTNSTNLPLQLRKSTPDVSTDPRGGTTNNRDSSALRNANSKSSSKEEKRESKKQEKGRKDAEKKQLAENKKMEKLAKQEQEKQDKIRIQQEREMAKQHAKDVKARKEQKTKKKGAAPQGPSPQASVAKATLPPAPVPEAPSRPPPQPPQRSNPLGQQTQYSTNTLESSISRSSGPPPYSETTKPPEKQPNKKDVTGNTSFSKPIENSSWDLISEHRDQINRNPVASGSKSKQMVMDLQFSFHRAQNNEDKNNSDV